MKVIKEWEKQRKEWGRRAYIMCCVYEQKWKSISIGNGTGPVEEADNGPT